MQRVCQWCQKRAELGWYGDPKIHHCRNCHRTWTGTAKAHCVSCHHHFSSNSAADRHIIGESCHPPQEVRDKNGVPLLGLRQDKYGYTWAFAGDGSPWWLAKHISLDEAGLPEEPANDTATGGSGSFAGDGSPWWLATHVELDIRDDASADSQGVEIPGPQAAGL